MDTMTTTGSAEILNKIINIATGREDNPADYSAGELIAVGTKLLKTDFNKFVTAMSQVMSYTIFKTERPGPENLKPLSGFPYNNNQTL